MTALRVPVHRPDRRLQAVRRVPSRPPGGPEVSGRLPSPLEGDRLPDRRGAFGGLPHLGRRRQRVRGSRQRLRRQSLRTLAVVRRRGRATAAPEGIGDRPSSPAGRRGGAVGLRADGCRAGGVLQHGIRGRGGGPAPGAHGHRRDKVAVFAGSYHGVFDEVLVRPGPAGRRPAGIPLAPGIPASMVDNVLVLEYGAAESLELLRARAARAGRRARGAHPQPSARSPVAGVPAGAAHADGQRRAWPSCSTRSSAAFAYTRAAPRRCSGSTPTSSPTARSWAVGSRSAWLRARAASWMPWMAARGPTGITRSPRSASRSSPERSCGIPSLSRQRGRCSTTSSRAGRRIQAALSERTSRFVHRLAAQFDEVALPVQLPHFSSWFCFELPSGSAAVEPILPAPDGERCLRRGGAPRRS